MLRPQKTHNFIRLIGGADRDRTDDLVIANDALSQLSYGPTVLIICGLCLRVSSRRQSGFRLGCASLGLSGGRRAMEATE